MSLQGQTRANVWLEAQFTEGLRFPFGGLSEIIFALFVKITTTKNEFLIFLCYCFKY